MAALKLKFPKEAGMEQAIANSDETPLRQMSEGTCPEEEARIQHSLEDWEIPYLRRLFAEGQEHLFAHWSNPAHQDNDKHHFFKQVERLDRSYPGGLGAYILNARKLLEQSKMGENPFEGYTPSVPSGEQLVFGDEEFVAFEREGVKAARNAAFVLVAGGLGERLGFSGIKLALPCQTTTGVCFLQLYIETILALQEASDASQSALDGSNTPVRIPLVIMTSDDTHARTEELLVSHKYFGMEVDQVVLLKQEKVACLADNSARIAIDPADPFAIQTKPHGHGDVHRLLYSSGLLPKWKAKGLKWVLLFQDTNSLLFKAIPASLGVSVTRGYDVNSLAVPRKAKEAIGGITKLTHTDGRSIVINVEYNQLDPLLRATGHPEGDVNDESGFSPFPGNINQLIMKLDSYIEELNKTKGAIAEFVNPKYTDATKNSFKSSTRLECMMQDYPKTLPPTAKVGFTVVDVWLGYSPVKNNAVDAAAKVSKGTPPHSATSGEMDTYRANALIFRKIGVSVDDPVRCVFNEQEVEVWPRIIWSPKWALTCSDVKAKVPGRGRISISQRSTLVIDGPSIILEELHLDGALVIRGVSGAKVRVSGLTVRNEGWELEAIDSSDPSLPEVLRMRGFDIRRNNHRELVFDTPGDYIVTD